MYKSEPSTAFPASSPCLGGGRMATMEVGVGVDVSKDTLEVATSDVAVAGSYANTVEGLADLVGALAGVAVHRVVLEASGGTSVWP